MSQSDGPRAPRQSEPPSLPVGVSGSDERTGSAASPAKDSTTDVVLIHGPTEDQKGLRVLRAREQGIEFGEVRPVQEGKPLSGEVVRLRPRPGMPRVCDVETQVSREELDRARGVSAKSLGHAGPARVTSDAYRTNWDAIYSSTTSPGSDSLN